MAAVGAIYEAQKLGFRIPQDVSVVGFDDTVGTLDIGDDAAVGLAENLGRELAGDDDGAAMRCCFSLRAACNWFSSIRPFARSISPRRIL